MIDKLQSVVIVRNPKGAQATLRFSDYKLDRMLTTQSRRKEAIYEAIERYLNT
jgi:hypothetical protein